MNKPPLQAKTGVFPTLVAGLVGVALLLVGLGLVVWGLTPVGRWIQDRISTSLALSAHLEPTGPGPEKSPAEPQREAPATVEREQGDTLQMEGSEESVKEPGETEKSTQSPRLVIRGSVQQHGLPVTNGWVKVTIRDFKHSFKQSVHGRLNEDGFQISDVASLRGLDPEEALQIHARVWFLEEERGEGTGAPAAAPDGESLQMPADRSVRTISETVHLNYPVSAGFRNLANGFILFLALLFFAFLFVFTGRDDSRTKNRWAIAMSYCVIFIALALALGGPIVTLRMFPDLPEHSRNSPVGLVRAPLDGDSENPQWLLNIGGSARDEGTPVTGGIQIPLFVIILSVISGAVNMTREVPKYQAQQQSSETSLPRALARGIEGLRTYLPGFKAPAKAARAAAQIEEPTSKAEDGEAETSDQETLDWRQGLLNQYMALVAAPFLAIATYFLLVLLGTVATPIVVLVSLSVGLMSDTIVEKITVTARGFFANGLPGEAGAAAASPAPPPPPPADDVPEEELPEEQPADERSEGGIPEKEPADDQPKEGLPEEESSADEPEARFR